MGEKLLPTRRCGRCVSTTESILSSSASMTKCLKHQSLGLLNPIKFQHMLNSYHIQNLQLSRNKDAQFVHNAAINDLDIETADNRYLLSGAADGSIAVHDLETLSKEESTITGARSYKLVCSVLAGNRDAHRRSIETVQWYPLDNGIFTSSGMDRILKIWDTNRLQTAEEYSFNGSVHCHQMSPIATKHSFIAVGTDSSVVKLVDPRAGSAIHSLRGHKEGAVRTVCWSNRDEFLLATGGIDNFAILWDIRTANGCLMKLQRMGGKKHSGYYNDTTHDGSVNGLHFTSNGTHLASLGTDQKLYLWDTWTGKRMTTHYPALSRIKKRSVKSCLTSCGSENHIFVPTGSCITDFDIVPGARSRHLYGHYNKVNCCVYHEGQNQLISGGNDQKILLWTLRGDKDYEEFLSFQREELIERSAEEHSSEAPALLPPAVAQTLDSWSDDDDDDDDEDENIVQNGVI